MKLTELVVDRYEGYSNRPSFRIYIDEFPPQEKFIYEPKVLSETTTLYFAEADGAVNFYSHNVKNQTGYGGVPITIPVMQGDEVVQTTLKGPWSSRAGVMNVYGFPFCIDAAVIQLTRPAHKGSPPTSGVTVAWLLTQGVRVGQVNYGSDLAFEILTDKGELHKPLHKSFPDEFIGEVTLETLSEIII